MAHSPRKNSQICLGAAAGKEVCVFIRAADEEVFLGQGQFGLSGERFWRSIDGGQGVGHEALGERLDVLVAVDSALASRVDQAVRVGSTEAHNPLPDQ